jgi:hemerythrin
MEILKWDDSMSVQIQEIDDQHKKLISLLNNFYTELQDGSVREKLGKLLDGLLEYTDFHFTTEENYMQKFNFEGFESHKNEHAAFIEKVQDVKKRYDEGKMVVSPEVTNYIKDWLVKHIKGTDQEYIQCFRENGLQ